MFQKSYNQKFLQAIQDNNSNIFNLKNKVDYNTPQIVLENVNTVYEGEIYPTLYDINLKVYKGEFLFIIGPNGAGKTTLLETILGILPIEKGSVEVNGVSVFKNGRKIRKKIGYLIQGVEFDPQTPFLVKTALMTARSGRLGLLRFPKKEDWKIVRYCYDSIRNMEELEDYLDRPIGKLSGGMQQKVQIANILAAEPEILLLDEPFSNLDINSRQEIYQLFLRLNRYANITILCVSHGNEIPKEVDRVIMIQKGRIIINEKREITLKSNKFQAYSEFMKKE
ncbi:MAG: metal ABC transporter ATP-binding protein [Promethearchaeota archaeon]